MFKKIEREKFINGVLNILGPDIINSASENKQDRDRHEIWFHGEKIHLDTNYGPLEIRGITATRELLTVFQAFRDMDQLSTLSKILGDDMNRYNGKWNFHFSGDESEEVLNQMKYFWGKVGLKNLDSVAR